VGPSRGVHGGASAIGPNFMNLKVRVHGAVPRDQDVIPRG